jgi:hypothetical protein
MSGRLLKQIQHHRLVMQQKNPFANKWTQQHIHWLLVGVLTSASWGTVTEDFTRNWQR